MAVKNVPSPRLLHHTPKRCTFPLQAFAQAGPPATNGPLGLSYLVEAVRPFWAPMAPLSTWSQSMLPWTQSSQRMPRTLAYPGWAHARALERGQLPLPPSLLASGSTQC